MGGAPLVNPLASPLAGAVPWAVLLLLAGPWACSWVSANPVLQGATLSPANPPYTTQVDPTTVNDSCSRSVTPGDVLLMFTNASRHKRRRYASPFARLRYTIR